MSHALVFSSTLITLSYLIVHHDTFAWTLGINLRTFISLCLIYFKLFDWSLIVGYRICFEICCQGLSKFKRDNGEQYFVFTLKFKFSFDPRTICASYSLKTGQSFSACFVFFANAFWFLPPLGLRHSS